MQSVQEWGGGGLAQAAISEGVSMAAAIPLLPSAAALGSLEDVRAQLPRLDLASGCLLNARDELGRNNAALTVQPFPNRGLGHADLSAQAPLATT